MIGNSRELGDLRVELVVNLAEKFLEQIFERDQAEQTPVLVHHQRYLKTAAAHLVEQVGQELARRDEIRGPHQALHSWRRRIKTARSEILCVQDPDDVVLAAAIDRHSRKTFVRDFRHQLRHRNLDVERENPVARRHDFLHAARAEVEHPMNHFALSGFDLALVLAEPEQRLSGALSIGAK